MSPVSGLALAVCALLLIHGSIAENEDKLKVNLLNVSAERDKIYSLEIPSDGRVNFTAIVPKETSCFMSGARNNVSFVVGGIDDDCIMNLWWFNDGNYVREGIFLMTSKDQEHRSFLTHFDVSFLLEGHKIIIRNESMYGGKIVYDETALETCALTTFMSQYGTTAINFTVKSQNAEAFSETSCKEIMFQFADGIEVVHAHPTTAMPIVVTTPLSPHGGIHIYLLLVLGAAFLFTVILCLVCVCVCCRKTKQPVSAAPTMNSHTPLITSEAKSEGLQAS